MPRRPDPSFNQDAKLTFSHMGIRTGAPPPQRPALSA